MVQEAISQVNSPNNKSVIQEAIDRGAERVPLGGPGDWVLQVREQLFNPDVAFARMVIGNRR